MVYIYVHLYLHVFTHVFTHLHVFIYVDIIGIIKIIRFWFNTKPSYSSFLCNYNEIIPSPGKSRIKITKSQQFSGLCWDPQGLSLPSEFMLSVVCATHSSWPWCRLWSFSASFFCHGKYSDTAHTCLQYSPQTFLLSAEACLSLQMHSRPPLCPGSCSHDLPHAPVWSTSAALVRSKCSQGWDISSPVILTLHPLLCVPNPPQILCLGSDSSLSFSSLAFALTFRSHSSNSVCQSQQTGLAIPLEYKGSQLSKGEKNLLSVGVWVRQRRLTYKPILSECCLWTWNPFSLLCKHIPDSCMLRFSVHV